MGLTSLRRAFLLQAEEAHLSQDWTVGRHKCMWSDAKKSSERARRLSPFPPPPPLFSWRLYSRSDGHQERSRTLFPEYNAVGHLSEMPPAVSRVPITLLPADH